MIKIEASNNKKLITDLFFCNELIDGFDPERKIKNLNFKKYRFFILFRDKIAVGLCVFHLFKDKSCVAHIGIKEKYRGKEAYKAGRIIVYRLLKLFNKIWIQIRKENKKALIYALHLGFRLIGEVKGHKILEMQRWGQ